MRYSFYLDKKSSQNKQKILKVSEHKEIIKSLIPSLQKPFTIKKKIHKPTECIQDYFF